MSLLARISQRATYPRSLLVAKRATHTHTTLLDARVHRRVEQHNAAVLHEHAVKQREQTSVDVFLGLSMCASGAGYWASGVILLVVGMARMMWVPSQSHSARAMLLAPDLGTRTVPTVPAAVIETALDEAAGDVDVAERGIVAYSAWCMREQVAATGAVDDADALAALRRMMRDRVPIAETVKPVPE